MEPQEKQTTAEIEELYRDIDKNGGLKLTDDGRPSIKRATYEKVVSLSERAAGRASYTDESTKADYDEIRRYVKNNPVKISEQDKSNIADFESYKRSNFGNMTVSNKGVSMDSFYQSLAEQYPHYFDAGKYTNPGDQMAHVNTVLSNLKPKVIQLSPAEQQTMASEMTKHIIGGYFVKDDLKIAKAFFDIFKFNPYHDQLGRFTTPGGAASFTYSPGKSKAHDAAISREKERMAAAGGTVKVGDIRERKGLKVKVMDLKDDKALVEVLEGEAGTRKPGSKFTMDRKTLENGSSAAGTSEPKAIRITADNGTVLSYRVLPSGVITDMNKSGRKNTQGMTLSQLADRAKNKGWKVETYNDQQLSDYDSKRAKDREETKRFLNYHDARGRGPHSSPRKGWKGH